MGTTEITSQYIVPEPLLPDSRLKNIQALCEIKTPYQSHEKSDALFVKAMKENIQWHQESNSFYQRLLKINSFEIGQLKEISDLADIPMIPALFFKTHESLSVEHSKIILTLTSSGTSGQKSQMFYDDWSIHSPQRMVESIFNYYNWKQTHQPANYLLYTYEVENQSKLGTAYTDNFLCQFAPVNEVFTALRATGRGQHEFDVFGTIENSKQYSQQQLPVRIFGFPAFLYATLLRIKDLGLKPLSLTSDSLIFLGGGWKGAAAKAIDSSELYQMAHELLGLPLSRIRDGYGSVEHCIPYVECAHHHFHVPAWSRVLIRDPESLKPLPYYQKGFLNLISPYITSVPAQSVLMDDLAVLYPGKDCPCGIETPFFKILGRASKSKNKSCAIAASELLREKVL